MNKKEFPNNNSPLLMSSPIDWLLACPHRGFFEPISSESADSLRSPLFDTSLNQIG